MRALITTIFILIILGGVYIKLTPPRLKAILDPFNRTRLWEVSYDYKNVGYSESFWRRESALNRALEIQQTKDPWLIDFKNEWTGEEKRIFDQWDAKMAKEPPETIITPFFSDVEVK